MRQKLFYECILARIDLTVNYYKQSPDFLIKIQNIGSPSQTEISYVLRRLQLRWRLLLPLVVRACQYLHKTLFLRGSQQCCGLLLPQLKLGIKILKQKLRNLVLSLVRTPENFHFYSHKCGEKINSSIYYVYIFGLGDFISVHLLYIKIIIGYIWQIILTKN